MVAFGKKKPNIKKLCFLMVFRIVHKISLFILKYPTGRQPMSRLHQLIVKEGLHFTTTLMPLSKLKSFGFSDLLHVLSKLLILPLELLFCFAVLKSRLHKKKPLKIVLTELVDFVKPTKELVSICPKFCRMLLFRNLF